MPIVASNQLRHDVAANVSGIDPAGARALDDWFASINLGYGDRVTVDDPVSYGAAERRAAVAPAVGRYGLLLAGPAPVTRRYVPAGMVPGGVRSRNAAGDTRTATGAGGSESVRQL